MSNDDIILLHKEINYLTVAGQVNRIKQCIEKLNLLDVDRIS